EIILMTQSKYVDHLIALAKNADVSNTIRAIARGRLAYFAGTGEPNTLVKIAKDQHRNYLGEKAYTFLNLPEELTVEETLKAPDGSPIGMSEMSCDFEF